MDRNRPSFGARVAVLLGALLMLLPAATVAAAETPQLSIGDAVVAEPANNTGTVAAELPVTVHGGSGGPISVAWRTVAGSASTADFVSASGTLSIPAGAPGGAIAVQVRADRTNEPVESFTVELRTPTGATIADPAGQVQIRAGASGLSLGDVAAVEPDAGSLAVAIPATIGAPAKKAVTFGWQLRSATATVGSDAPAASGTASISKGAMGTLVRIQVAGDTAVEADEDLEVVVTSVANALLSDGVARLTLRNTDVAPPPPPPPPDPFGWNPPSGAIPADGSVVYVESSAGDFIGRGATYRYTLADSVMHLANKPNRFDLSVDGDESWDLSIAEPATNTSIQPGYWENVGRYPFHVPGLSFTGEGRGCNTVLGRFIVDQVTYFADLIDTITVRFEQRCEVSGPPLRGFLRWDRSDPTVPPPPGDPALFGWLPPADVVALAGNYLYFESPAGDYIGQGRTDLYTDTRATFTPDWSGPLVQLFVNDPTTVAPDWSLDLNGRVNQPQLAVGLYEDVQRYPFDNRAKGGLDFSGEGRGCNELDGDFAVDEITYDADGLVSISARFRQSCEGAMPALHGAVHWERP